MNKIEAQNPTQTIEKFADVEVRGPEIIQTLKLGNTGIPFPAAGDTLVLKAKGQKEMSQVNPDFLYVLDRDKDGFTANPVSNIRYTLEESGEWGNSSYICDLVGLDEQSLDYLKHHGGMTMRLLLVDETVAEASGSHWMAEIGFGEHGQEFNLLRVLLPNNFAVEKSPLRPTEVAWYEAEEKMPEAVTAIWNLLQVDKLDPIWDQRVKDHLLGNVRNLDKKIEILNIENRDLISGWISDEKSWGGLYVDKSGIDGFLEREAAEANLKVGEVLVSKFGHGSGGVSAATAGDQEEMKLVGDVVIRLADGRLVERAVEGTEAEIDGLIGDLTAQMRQDYGLVDSGVSQSGLTLDLAQLPVLPMAAYPMSERLIPESLVTPTPALRPTRTDLEGSSVIKKSQQVVVEPKPNRVDVFVAEIIEPTIKADWDWQEGQEAAQAVRPPDEPSWPLPDDGDWDDGGDGVPDQPLNPRPGGGGGLARPEVNEPSRSVLVGQVRGNEKPVSWDGTGPQGHSDKVTQEKSTSGTEPEVTEVTVAQKHSDTVSQSAEPEPPWLPVEFEGIDVKDMPEWQQKDMVVELNHSLVVPGLKAEENLTEDAEMAFEQGKWPEFDYLKQIIEQVEWIVLIPFFDLMNTTLTQFEPNLVPLWQPPSEHRGSGLSLKAIWPKTTEVAGALI